MGFMVPAEVAWDPEQNKNVIVSIGDPEEINFDLLEEEVYVFEHAVSPITKLAELEQVVLTREGLSTFETFQNDISPQVPFTQEICSLCSVRQATKYCRGPPFLVETGFKGRHDCDALLLFLFFNMEVFSNLSF
jgi:hypothetical protein